MSGNRSGGFVMGIVVGALAGAALGLLWSPRPGKENRELITEHFPELRERAPEMINRATNEARSRFEAGREAFLAGAAETRARMTHELDEAQEGRASVA